MRERTDLESRIDQIKRVEQELADNIELIELGETENDEGVVAEAEAAIKALRDEAAKQQIETLLSGEADEMDTYLEVHSGAGGTESQDWAEMLLRMYTRWADRRGFKVELIDRQDGEGAGIKGATILVKGRNAYGWMKTESGVHRLVRISPFDSNARRQTSFASIDVYPVVDDRIQIDIDESQVRVDTMRSGGAGGQHVNKTESAVRITHLPTGIVAECQDDRSQHRNRDKAMKVLLTRLRDMQERAAHEREAAHRKSLVGSGDRSERIRTYNFPQGRVTDHRINLTLYKLQSVMDGDLGELTDALIQAQIAEQVAALEEAA